MISESTLPNCVLQLAMSGKNKSKINLIVKSFQEVGETLKFLIERGFSWLDRL